MEIYRAIEDIDKRKPSALALGLFDGLHLGHTALIKSCVEYARGNGLSADIFTFRYNPKNVLEGELLIPRLMTESEKLLGFQELGIDRVFDFNFTDDFHTMSPERFARELLKDAFSAEAVFCGFNFSFGANASGKSDTMKELGQAIGFETHVLDPVYVSDHLVSSTLIRRCVNSGDIEPANRLLGRDFSLSGIVKKGRKLGRVLEFPTANFTLDAEITVPAYGVYVTETLADAVLHPSVTNVGIAPTIKDMSSMHVESHILDKNLTLYGKKIKVHFKKRLREERFFDSKEALQRQIVADAESARQYFYALNR